MDNKKLKITVIAIAVAGIVGGGGYFAKSTIDSRHEVIEQQITNFSKGLPSQFKFQKVDGEDGLLSSTATYRLSFTHPINDQYNGAIVIKYEAEHGFSSLFNGQINFKGSTAVDGKIVKSLNIKTADNILSKIEGTIDSEGNISMSQTGSESSLVIPVNGKDINFKLKPFSSKIDYVASSGEITKIDNFPEIKGTDANNNAWTVLLKNTETKYTSNIGKLQQNKHAIKIGMLEIPTEKIKLEGININNSSEEKAKKPIIKFDSKVSKVNTEKYKDASLEFKASLEGFDKNLFLVYQDLLPVYISKEKIYDHKSFIKGMKSGLLFNIEKFSFQSSVEKFDITGKYEISPTSEGKVFSLAEQTKLGLSVNANPALLQNILGDNTEWTGTNSDSVAITVNYAGRILKVNDVEAQEPIATPFIELLEQLENENGLGTPKHISDGLPNVQEQPKPEMKVETKEEVKPEEK